MMRLKPLNVNAFQILYKTIMFFCNFTFFDFSMDESAIFKAFSIFMKCLYFESIKLTSKNLKKGALKYRFNQNKPSGV